MLHNEEVVTIKKGCWTNIIYIWESQLCRAFFYGFWTNGNQVRIAIWNKTRGSTRYHSKQTNAFVCSSRDMDAVVKISVPRCIVNRLQSDQPNLLPLSRDQSWWRFRNSGGSIFMDGVNRPETWNASTAMNTVLDPLCIFQENATPKCHEKFVVHLSMTTQVWDLD